MKKLMLIMLIAPNLLLAEGAEWLLEINCNYDGKPRTIYVVSNSIDRLPVDSEERKSVFPDYFFHIYGTENSVNVFNKIFNQEIIAQHAGFPMHAYLIDETSAEELLVSKIKDVTLVKVWQRSTYGIDVLTKLYPKDTSWIENCKNPSNFGFDDVGCRIELFSENPVDENDPDVSKIYSLINNTGNQLNQDEIAEIKPYIISLKRKRIVVVQLCGC